jgi:hypothetical protein
LSKELTKNQKLSASLSVGIGRLFLIPFVVMILLGNIHAEFPSVPTLGYWTLFGITFFADWLLVIVHIRLKTAGIRMQKKFDAGIYV